MIKTITQEKYNLFTLRKLSIRSRYGLLGRSLFLGFAFLVTSMCLFAQTQDTDGGTFTNSTVVANPNAATLVQPDLSVTKIANTLSPRAGENVTFTITATNLGPGIATNVRGIDRLNSGYNFVSATASYQNAAGISGNEPDPNTTNNISSITPVPVFPDFDGDGVADITDLDDDNDGILDGLECPNQSLAVGWQNDSPAGTLNADFTPTNIATALPQVFGSGLTLSLFSTTGRQFANIDATTLAQAITDNAYVEYGFSVFDLTNTQS